MTQFQENKNHFEIQNLSTVGYTTSDVLYRWNSRAVAISEDLRMSQFDLIDVPSSNESLTIGDGFKELVRKFTEYK